MGKIHYTPADSTLNTLNLKMRQTDWYQGWFKSRGLNPNQVRLNDKQQAELEQVMASHGFAIPEGIHVDPAGNWNTHHGWAGLPAVTKAAIVTLAAVGTAGSLGAFGSVGGAPTATSGSAALGTVPEASFTSAAAAFPGSTAVGASTAPLTFGSVAAGGAPNIAANAGGPSFANILKNPKTWATAGRVLGKAGEASAQNRGAQAEVRYNVDALGLQRDQTRLLAEKSARDAQSDAMNKALWGNYVSGYQPSQRPEGTPSRIDNSISEESRAAGRLLAQQANDLMKSGQYTQVNPTISSYEDYPTEPGGFERFTNSAAPGLSFYDLYRDYFEGDK